MQPGEPGRPGKNATFQEVINSTIHTEGHQMRPRIITGLVWLVFDSVLFTKGGNGRKGVLRVIREINAEVMLGLCF